MFVIIRTIIYASLFIGLVLIYVPARLLAWSGIFRPERMDVQQVVGIIMGTLGALAALWCIFTFATIGRGTPAPFDPPRRLVIRGSYRYVRNPMYIGAGFALAGAALFYGSWQILGYLGFLFLVTHLMIVLHEEPTLRQSFGEDYQAYCKRVRRWIPGINRG